jgi:hypothetical protein
MHRFTPRKARSNWSAVNIKRARNLDKCGRMAPSGRKAFAARDEKQSRIHALQWQRGELGATHKAIFTANKTAWAFFQAQPPGISTDHNSLGRERETGGNVS